MKEAIKKLNPFRNLKLQTKLTLCIILVVVIPIIVAIAAFSRPLYNMVIASTIRDEQNASALIAPQIEDKVDTIVRNMELIQSHPYMEEWFQSPIKTSPEELTLSADAYDFQKTVDSIIKDGPVDAVRIYLGLPKDSPVFIMNSSKDLIRPESEITTTYWHGIFDGTNYASLFCPEFYLQKSEISDLGDSAYIVRKSFYYRGRVYPAYIALYYNSEIYDKVLKDAIVTEGSVSYIINDRESLVVATDKALSGTYRLRYSAIRDALLASNSFVEREIAGVPVYVAFYMIEKPGWFMVNVIPKAPVTAIADRWMINFLVICLLSLLMATTIGITVSRSVTKRIAAVSKQMARIHDGPPVAMPESYLNDEVGDLIRTYNYMTEEMNNLIEEKEETAQELRFAEFNALQAQINPHFLYNTMDMINWMSLQGKNEEVSEVVQNLSKFYKLTLSRKKDYSTIADELEHAEVYVELQNMRFNNAIEFVVDVPDELTQCRIPKLTFQPILENAILHGILETEAKVGTIVLTVWAEADDIKILISDDGVGMDEEVRQQILSEERIKPTSSRGANVAVVNIHRRLQLLYGEKYGLSYESSPGKGCEVTILIPRDMGDYSYKEA